MKTKVFRVTIHYQDRSKSTIDVIAPDDLRARNLAIKDDLSTWVDSGQKAPKLDFCEVELICKPIQ